MFGSPDRKINGAPDGTINRTIVAIGGGEISEGDTLPIDAGIVKMTGKTSPRLLFIPTASSDSESYSNEVQKYFQEQFGCLVKVLKLLKNTHPINVINEMISSADIIYVGGGNTLKMMRLWRRLGVDLMLKEAYERGTVLCGISAGSICWFDFGHSDSLSFYSPDSWKYINVRGLGFIKGVHCPHFDGSTLGIPRRSHFQNMMQRIGDMGIAIDNNCAIKFVNGSYQVIAASPSANAFRVFKQDGKVVIVQIEKREHLSPIEELYKR